MDELVAFTTARLDEDEENARAGFSHPKRWTMVPPGIPNGLSCTAVLREVEAKRRILEEHDPAHDPCDAHGANFETIPCPTLCLLALPYADHEDYRDEWRP